MAATETDLAPLVGTTPAKETLMKTPIVIITAGMSFILCSCDKPTSGQNTSEYRDGNSGASSQTIEKDTSLDSTKGREDKDR